MLSSDESETPETTTERSSIPLVINDSIRLAPSLSRMGFDRVYLVYYEISFELETENERDL